MIQRKAVEVVTTIQVFRHTHIHSHLQYDIYIVLRIESTGFADRLNMDYETKIPRIIIRILA